MEGGNKHIFFNCASSSSVEPKGLRDSYNLTYLEGGGCNCNSLSLPPCLMLCVFNYPGKSVNGETGNKKNNACVDLCFLF